MPAPTPSTLDVYLRALKLLGSEGSLAGSLAAASVAIGIVQLVEPVLFGRVVDALSKGTGAFDLIAIWAALGLFGIFASVVVAVIADRLAHRRRLAAMVGAFEHAIALPLGYHAAKGSGAVIRSIEAGAGQLFWIWLSAMREQLTALTSIILLVPTAISIDWRMALILAALALSYVGINVVVMRRTAEGQANVEQYHSDVAGRVGDVIGNVTVVQSFTRLAAEAEAMRGLAAQLLRAQYPVLTWWGVLTVLQRAAATITMVTVFATGAVLADRGEMTVGEIVSFVAFAGLLIGKLDQLSSFVASINRAAPALRTYFALLDEPVRITDVPGAMPLGSVSGAVRFERVSFVFEGTTQGVFDLEIEARTGETVALVGPTGSGKTTTLTLLQRLRAPDSGRITIDGQDISRVTLSSLRAAVAVVFQDAGLFNRSISDNVRIGRPDATDDEVESACRLAEAHEFIMAKPGGYQFRIGERGNALSGGERQRLAVARAILKDAPILVLDEATSALDAETEAKIKRAVDRVRAGRTTFVIAHRLSTVANADRIYVLDKGRIVEQGRFTDLARAGGLFERMVREGGFTVPEGPQDGSAPKE
ncbi:MAG: glucan ABC transporter ATP-binding protein/ permease [Hyphomicrobium sp.]|nr:glucan ABC transporter ATP-binding protein/ permease [Hyphomicrobium sp.]